MTEAELDADRWWDDARARERDFLLGAGGLGRRPSATEAGRRLQRLSSPYWIPERKPPKLPSRWDIASYWAELGLRSWFYVDIDNPHCFACGIHGGIGGTFPGDAVDPESRWHYSRRLQRGHIVNRARNGLDALQNLTLLCGFCNKNMPIFGPEAEGAAIAWINSGGAIAELEKRLAARSRAAQQLSPGMP